MCMCMSYSTCENASLLSFHDSGRDQQSCHFSCTCPQPMNRKQLQKRVVAIASHRSSWSSNIHSCRLTRVHTPEKMRVWKRNFLSTIWVYLYILYIICLIMSCCVCHKFCRKESEFVQFVQSQCIVATIYPVGRVGNKWLNRAIYSSTWLDVISLVHPVEKATQKPAKFDQTSFHSEQKPSPHHRIFKFWTFHMIVFVVPKRLSVSCFWFKSAILAIFPQISTSSTPSAVFLLKKIRQRFVSL